MRSVFFMAHSWHGGAIIAKLLKSVFSAKNNPALNAILSVRDYCVSVCGQELFLGLFLRNELADLDELYVENKGAVRLDSAGAVLAISEF